MVGRNCCESSYGRSKSNFCFGSEAARGPIADKVEGDRGLAAVFGVHGQTGPDGRRVTGRTASFRDLLSVLTPEGSISGFYGHRQDYGSRPGSKIRARRTEHTTEPRRLSKGLPSMLGSTSRWRRGTPRQRRAVLRPQQKARHGGQIGLANWSAA